VAVTGFTKGVNYPQKFLATFDLNALRSYGSKEMMGIEK
jgi:hypothetical protein